MNEDRSIGRAGRVILFGAALVVVIAGIRAAEAILVPFLVSVFVAIICWPMISWLQSRKVPTSLALLIVIAALAAIGLGMAAIVGNSVNAFTNRLPQYQIRLEEETSAIFSWLQVLGFQISLSLVRDLIDPAAAMRLVGNILTGVGGLLTNAFLILLTVVFILLEASSFPLKLRVVTGDARVTMPEFGQFTKSVHHYLAIKTWISLATGVAAALWVWVLGVDLPVLWGLLAFLLNYIPNIGSIIAGVPPVLLGLIQFGVERAVLVTAGYVAINVLLGQLLETRLLGHGVGLSTLVVFMSLVFWGWIFGGVGMLLAVPLTMILKIALETSDDTRWVAVLLGSRTSADVLAAAKIEAP